MKGVKVEKLSKESIHYWMEHPVTQRMLLMIESSRDLHEQELQGIVKNNRFKNIDQDVVSEIKGMLIVLDDMTQIKYKLFEILEEETQDEISNTRPESPTKGS